MRFDLSRPSVYRCEGKRWEHDINHEALTLAEQHGFIKTAGSDFHIESQAGLAGMIAEDAIEDQYMLRDYLRSKKQKLNHEVR